MTAELETVAQAALAMDEDLQRDDGERSGGATPRREAHPERLEALLAFVPEPTESSEGAAEAEAEDDPRPRDVPAPSPALSLTPGVRSAELVALSGRTARVLPRGQTSAVEVALAPEVELALIEEALRDDQRVLLEVLPDAEPLVVGVLQVHRPKNVTIRGEVVEIEAARGITLRSGRAGLRMDTDGDVELVATRFSAMSRGLMRLVGRVLRLN